MSAALHDGRRDWSATEVDDAVATAAVALRQAGTRVLATLLDNGPDFVILDEAARLAGVVHVPLAAFFTPAQMGFALQAAGVDLLVAEAAWAVRLPLPGTAAWQPWAPAADAQRPLLQARLPAAAVTLPAGTAKITFTSGSTGTPKGVCLGEAALQQVVDGVRSALAPLAITRHLSALPYAVLLENVAGLMAPRQQGATVIPLPLAELGLQGSSSFDAARFDAAVRLHQPHSVILLPQMLRAWCAHLAHSGARAPAALKLVAVGGAAVGAPLVRQALALGIPVAEGYGLSEGASVQTLNLPAPAGASLAGSAGRVLPHARLRVAADGEIFIAGSLFSGYLGDSRPVPEWWPTGDLGRLDDEGFLHVQGRKSQLLITAYGRNVSPEWVETALRSQPAVLQAVVFGDGQPALSAVLWPSRPDAPDAELQAAVAAANAELPDYARLGHWVRARAAFDVASGLATANGRPQRAAIALAHAELLGLRSPAPTP